MEATTKAIEALKHSMKLAQAGEHAALVAEAVNNLAAAYVEAGEYRKAVEMHEHGFALLALSTDRIRRKPP